MISTGFFSAKQAIFEYPKPLNVLWRPEWLRCGPRGVAILPYDSSRGVVKFALTPNGKLSDEVAPNGRQAIAAGRQKIREKPIPHGSVPSLPVPCRVEGVRVLPILLIGCGLRPQSRLA